MANCESITTSVSPQPSPLDQEDDGLDGLGHTWLYNVDKAGVVEGFPVNMPDLKKLANWLCEIKPLRHSAPDWATRCQCDSNGGFCNECRDDAAFWLIHCPYIDMNKKEVL
jgi:hypothetical protein